MMGKDYMLAIIIVNCDDNIWGDRNFLPDPDLPSGWRTIRDSAGTYYWHVPSGTTQWRHPGLDGATPQSARAGREAAGSEAVPTDGGPRAPDDNSEVGGRWCAPSGGIPFFSARASFSVLFGALAGLAAGGGGRPGPGSRRPGAGRRHPPAFRSRRALGRGPPVEAAPEAGNAPPSGPFGPHPLVPSAHGQHPRVGGGRRRPRRQVSSLPLKTRISDQRVSLGIPPARDRDFAFVAADKDSCVLKCHVFRCDAPAEAIAGALHRACSQMMSQQTSRSLSADGISAQDPPPRVEFPRTETETGPESVRMFDVHYVGNLPVSRAMGMEVLNLAIESIVNATRRHEWEAAVIHVTDTFLSVFKEGEEPVWACQVRFLSFLGVGHDDRTFAVIADGGRQRFECHVFWCRPDAGPLSEAVQAACMVQYQKCLVAQTPPPRSRAWRQAPPKVKRANSVDGAVFQSGEAPGKGSGVPRRGMMAFLDTFRNRRAGAW
ncbi:amyloid-beta A4 precursor protein-binding family B member 3 isoform X2 [Stigmatopora argus]